MPSKSSTETLVKKYFRKKSAGELLKKIEKMRKLGAGRSKIEIMISESLKSEICAVVAKCISPYRAQDTKITSSTP
ncbi:MAG: hypothetical protein LAO31_13975 [Acidobacteriia bacterium]|nr:hypothetical protein [Terriglobia bacterium]